MEGGGGTKVRVMSGITLEAGRANERDAVQLWRRSFIYKVVVYNL